jgi:hypothetical protein
MTRWSHSKPEIRGALDEADAAGLKVEPPRRAVIAGATSTAFTPTALIRSVGTTSTRPPKIKTTKPAESRRHQH